MSTHHRFMNRAVGKAKAGVRAGQTPFGACIVKDGKVVGCAHNTVWKSGDITAHAEMNAIRQACRKLKTIDLSGCVLYSTCEPCPMCFSAAHWAGISVIVFGARIADAKKYGFNELQISNKKLAGIGKCMIRIIPGVLQKECRRLFTAWKKLNGRTY